MHFETGILTRERIHQTRVSQLCEAVQKRPDYFTPDRTFFMATRGDNGKRLGNLILAEGGTDRLYKHDWAWLDQLAGVIVASGDYDAPLIYRSEAELIRAWKELHSISTLRMNADDEEELDERLYEDEDSDEDEDDCHRRGAGRVVSRRRGAVGVSPRRPSSGSACQRVGS